MSFEFEGKALECLEKGCPKMQEMFARLNSAERHKDLAEHMAGHLVGEDGELIDRALEGSAEEMVQVLGLDIDDEILEDFKSHQKTSLRQDAAKHIDDIDQEIEDIGVTADMVARSCDGPLKMRGNKAHASYLATLCTSAAICLYGEDTAQIVNVSRTSR